MRFFNIVIILSSLTLTSSVLAQSQWIIPSPYKEEMVILEDKHVHFLDTTGNGAIYSYATKQQLQSKETSFWMTKCFRNIEKGIPITSCLIQFPPIPNIEILVSPHKTQVIFLPFKSKEFNYKVDNKGIKSFDSRYLLDKNIQNKILYDLLNGKKIIYSYKLGTEYQTKEIPIENLKKHYEFSNAFINVN